MLTQQRIIENLHYDPKSGLFVRIKRSGRALAGSEAGGITRQGYKYIRVCGGRYMAHRLAFLYMTGAFPSEEVDHINGIRDDNRWDNLRSVSGLENGRNQRLYATNTTGACGVYWCARDQHWVAQIQINGRRKSLGYFRSKKDAIVARISAEQANGFSLEHGKSRTRYWHPPRRVAA